MKRVRNRFLLRTAATGFVAFVVVGILVLAFPSAYPRALVRMLDVVAPWLDEDLSLHAFSMQGTEGQFAITTGLLERFNDQQGRPFPSITMDYTFDLGVYNTYPLIVLTLLACIPLGTRRRLYLLAFGFAGLFVAGLLDLIIIWNWMSLEGASAVVSSGGFHIPGTEANQAVLLEVEQSIGRVTLAKSFLSTGGRQFLSVLVVGICLFTVYPKK